MPSISSLFFSTDPEKQTLHKRIIPSEDQRIMQKERWHDLEDCLKEDLKEKTGYAISAWIQGSYKFGTQIRPAHPDGEFDIDLGIYFSWEGNQSEGRYGPKELKTFVQESIFKYAEEVGDEIIEIVRPPKTRCSRVRFSENFHIDVPSYHLDPVKDNRSLATEDNIWEESDPKALYLWFREQCSEDEDNLIRRLIRYFKIWSSLNFNAGCPSTVVLTVLVTEAFALLKDEQKEGDDIALKYCLEYIIERLSEDASVLNPVNKNENLNRLTVDEFRLFLERLRILLDTATRGINSGTEIEAAIIWQEAFSHFFFIPLPANEEAPTQKALVKLQFDPIVSVSAVSNDNPTLKYSGLNKIGPIPQNCSIVFNLDNHSTLSERTSIEWMVRNEGRDAEISNDLGHRAGVGIQGKERSQYVGTHFMDVVVKSPYNEIIGYKRIPVTISGQVIPRTNKKKAWNGRLSKRQNNNANFINRYM